tara:strand:+ start:116 stop:502 length:387 start_codon:yes stop_codon:yes gene_type:complete
VGVTKITKNNYKEFFRRGKLLQILGGGIVTNEVDDSMPNDISRTLTLKEVEEHIGFEVENPNAIALDNKKWKNQVFSIIEERITDLATMEEEGLVPYTEAKQTINEENDKATEELEKLATDEPKKYPH